MTKKRLTYGTLVDHRKYGRGMVLQEWGPMMMERGNERSMCSCEGVYDVEFINETGTHFMHCCRANFLIEVLI